MNSRERAGCTGGEPDTSSERLWVSGRVFRQVCSRPLGRLSSVDTESRRDTVWDIWSTRVPGATPSGPEEEAATLQPPSVLDPRAALGMEAAGGLGREGQLNDSLRFTVTLRLVSGNKSALSAVTANYVFSVFCFTLKRADHYLIVWFQTNGHRGGRPVEGAQRSDKRHRYDQTRGPG